eukprot:837394-Heterocapsa_arctica.AAC.1
MLRRKPKRRRRSLRTFFGARDFYPRQAAPIRPQIAPTLILMRQLSRRCGKSNRPRKPRRKPKPRKRGELRGTFGIHKLSPPDESIADLIDRYDCEAIARYERDVIIDEAGRAASFAMPCSPVAPVRLSPVKRTIRFDDNVFIEEVPNDTPFKDYRYARDKIRTKSLKPVVRNPNKIHLRDLMSHAVARFRAIALANGRGLVNDPNVTEMWRGVEKIDPKESRKLPIVWTNDGYFITLRSDPN